jgi:hypothetical protein
MTVYTGHEAIIVHDLTQTLKHRPSGLRARYESKKREEKRTFYSKNTATTLKKWSPVGARQTPRSGGCDLQHNANFK